MPNLLPGWNQEKIIKKITKAVTQIINNVNSNFSDSFSYDNINSFDIVQIEYDIDLDSIPLTNDFYELQSLTDLTLTTEFPILHAAAAPSSAHTIKNQQTDAQRQATKLLRQKFKYPSPDPEPNIFRDSRTELQKIESILRTTSQILDPDQLSIWNEITERNLHLSQAHNSGIPLVKNDITDQIKTYRIDEEHKQSLLNKVKAFDKLYVQERLPDLQTTPDIAQPHENQSETNMPAEEEERPIDSDISSEILATSSSPGILSPPVLSTTINQLWIDDTTCHLTIVSILKLYSHICLSAIHCLLPYLQNTKIFSRILKKWDRFSPARHFRIKIANLLVRHGLISCNLLKQRS